ncbi:GNAT family N-acetyltransferase [Paenibacillus sp. NPDC057934]|uniref:GNAT family N-acetyltransferase n=1 Tax=Paenibacillus sp. NPDC057934 TaxID=3346282 RepID=UPI0036D76374
MGHIHEVSVREATAQDREAIAELMLEAYSQYATVMPELSWKEYSNSIRESAYGDRPEARIIAEIDGQIVGSVLLFLSSEAAYGKPELGIDSPIIRLLAVSPNARGRGIATLLIQESIRRSLELGASTLNLHTSDMMASAIQLYEKLGFQRAYETDIDNGDHLVKGFRLDFDQLQFQQNAVS